MSPLRPGPLSLVPPAPPRSLIGRERELKVLQSLTRAHRMVAIEGAPGAGKTALMAALASSLARAKKPLIYLTADPFLADDDFWARLMSELGRAVQPGMQGKLLIRAVLESAEAAGVTILLDDLERMPRGTANAVLPELFQGLRRARMVVATSDALPLADPLSAEIPRLAVRALSADAALELAGSGRPGDKPLARRDRSRLARATGGNPLAIRLAAADRGLAERLLGLEPVRAELDLALDLVQPVVEGLPRTERDALAMIAAASGRLPAAMARHAGVDPGALKRLSDRALVRSDSADWVAHPLACDAQAGSESPAAARALSRRLADGALAVWDARPPEIRWAILALHHLFRLGEQSEVARQLGRARGLFLTRGLVREYLAMLSQLGTEISERHPRLELDRAHLHARFHGPSALSRTLLTRLTESSNRAIAAAALAELAEIDHLAGDLPLALQRADESLRSLEVVGTQPELARALVRVGRLRLEAREWVRARETYEEAVRILTREGDAALLTDALLGLGQCLAEDGRHVEAHRSFLHALELQKSLPADPELSRAEAVDGPLSSRNLRAETYLRLGLYHRDRGHFREALAALNRSERAFRKAGDVRAAAEAAVSGGEVLLAMGRHNRARLEFEQGLIDLREVGSARGVAVAQLDIGLLAIESGDLKGAATSLAEALDGFAGFRDQRGVRAVQVAQANMMRLSGNRAGARVLLEGLLVEARRDQHGTEEAEILYRLASQALEEGDIEESRSRAEEAAVVFEANAHHKGLERVRGMLIRCAYLLGDLTTADRLAGEEVERARRRDDPRGLAMALTQAAEIRLEQRRPDDALEHAREAMGLRQRCGDERGLVASHRLSAEVYASTGSVAEARKIATRGLELARSRGMSNEQAHLHLLLGALALGSHRTADARAHADAASARSTGLADLQLLGLKLAQAAAMAAGDTEVGRRLEDTWFDRMQCLPAARVRHLFERLTRLGLDNSRRCVIRAGSAARATTLDRGALVESLALDVAVDGVRRRLRLKGGGWTDMKLRPSLLALLASAIRRSDKKPTVGAVARDVWGLDGPSGAREVAAAIEELGRFVMLAGKPVITLGGAGHDRVELAKGLRAGLLEEEC